MFENVPVAPPDSILGLTEAFNQDPNPRKVNLAVGVYKDAAGRTPVLKCVKAAEERLHKAETTKAYLPIDGSPQLAQLVQELIFGAGHEVLAARRCATSHTPSGTGAVRVASDYLRKLHPRATLWMSDPTWPNHPQIFEAAGLPTRSYPYFDAGGNRLAFDRMLAGLQQVPAGDVALLHGCCHNPTGVDPTPQQWELIGQVLAERKVLPLVDFAYQGFGTGLVEDALGVMILLKHCPEALICSSFSKNFGLYNERVGALTVVARDALQAQAVQSQIKSCIRANYSNPPAHGGAVVAIILADAALRAQWQTELREMCGRINGMRVLLVRSLQAAGVQRDFSFIAQQRGMFSFSGLNKQQVERLRVEHAVYIVGNGRINVAGMTEANMPALCQAIASVL